MMRQAKKQIAMWSAVGTMALAGALSSDAAARDGLITEPVIRGEQARLVRQAYDYVHRNSNNNVFRNSRHFHPTRNVFRSSRHYQQRVAASSDGYPLRTFVRFGRSIGGGDLKPVEFSFAHHRRHPFGLPTIEEPGLEALLFNGGPRHCRDESYAPRSRSGWVHYGSHSDDSYDGPRDPAPPHARPQYRVITPEGTVTNASAGDDSGRNGRQAVLRQVRDDDGTVRTVITNVREAPGLEATLNDAWQALTDGDAERAAELFNAQVMDASKGPEAMVGHGLARLLEGDEQAARTAFKRAQQIDSTVLDHIRLSAALRKKLRERRDDLSDAACIEVLEQLTK